MIFYNQETRKEFSENAEKELKSFVVNCMKYAIKNKDLIEKTDNIDNTLSDVYDSERMWNDEFPQSVAMMINRSGIVFPCDKSDMEKDFSKRHYPVNLYFDNAEDFEDEFVNAFTFFRKVGMNGGIVNGRIHT